MKYNVFFCQNIFLNEKNTLEHLLKTHIFKHRIQNTNTKHIRYHWQNFSQTQELLPWRTLCSNFIQAFAVIKKLWLIFFHTKKIKLICKKQTSFAIFKQVPLVRIGTRVWPIVKIFEALQLWSSRKSLIFFTFLAQVSLVLQLLESSLFFF